MTLGEGDMVVVIATDEGHARSSSESVSSGGQRRLKLIVGGGQPLHSGTSANLGCEVSARRRSMAA